MRIALFLSALLLLAACGPTRLLKSKIRDGSDSLQHHTGFVLYNPITRKTLVHHNADKYFTPASNTKIFTLLAGLNILGDSVPALRYIQSGDSTIIWGTGDPSFLYPEVYQNAQVFQFLKQAPGQLYFSSSNFNTSHYGSGWSWNDYESYYQAELSPLPIYGNLISASAETGIQPPHFKRYQTPAKGISTQIKREQFTNKFQVNPTQLKNTIVVPFITSDSLTIKLLSDTLHRSVRIIPKPLPKASKIIYSIPTDSLYSVMMKSSDNFVAEQILLMCAQNLTDTLSTEKAIFESKTRFSADVAQTLQWVDGSGLSRYNQCTPKAVTNTLEKLYHEVPWSRLQKLLATNGQQGTLRSFLANYPPIVFGKTGSLRNVYCLSGFIITKRKNVLIFSSMNAGFTTGTRPIRNNLESILKIIYEKY